MKRNIWLVVVVIALAMSVVGCSTESEESYDMVMEAPAMEVDRMEEYADSYYEMDSDGESFATDEGGVGFTSNASEVEIQERIVLKDASLTIKVEEPAETISAIAFMAERRGGFVVSSSTYQSYYYDAEREMTQGYIQIRVPAEGLTSAVDEIKNLTSDPKYDVGPESISGQDVTSQYMDLESRLRNLEDAAEQLRGFMEEADDTEAVLEVYKQLKSVNEEIEVIKGQLKYYDEASAMSSIYVEVMPKYAVKEIEIGGWNPQGVAKQAIQRLIDAFQFIVEALIWIVLLVIPVLILISLPVVVVILILRAIFKKKSKKTAKDSKEKKSDAEKTA